MNLIEIYFIAIVYCAYFDTFSLILCIFMIHVLTCTNVETLMYFNDLRFYLYKCWNSDEGESRKHSVYLVFALLMI